MLLDAILAVSTIAVAIEFVINFDYDIRPINPKLERILNQLGL